MPYSLRKRKSTGEHEEQVASKPAKKEKPAKKPRVSTGKAVPMETEEQPDEFKVLHDQIVAEIKKLGPKVKSLAHKPVATTKVGKKFQAAHATQSRIFKRVGVVQDTKMDVNAAVLKRSVETEIKGLGARPIALVATTVLNKGLDLHELTGPLPNAVSRSLSKEDLAKSISEFTKLKSKQPSEIKAKVAVAGAKISLNTEILKTAMVKAINNSGRRSPKSPKKSIF